jgi:hypothetical protein
MNGWISTGLHVTFIFAGVHWQSQKGGEGGYVSEEI